jgi:hypothetical protein
MGKPDEADPDLRAVTDQTLEEERREARMSASAGDEPTPEEERAADRNSLDPEVARHNKEAVERGANVRGEGQVEP